MENVIRVLVYALMLFLAAMLFMILVSAHQLAG